MGLAAPWSKNLVACVNIIPGMHSIYPIGYRRASGNHPPIWGSFLEDV